MSVCVCILIFDIFSCRYQTLILILKGLLLWFILSYIFRVEVWGPQGESITFCN